MNQYRCIVVECCGKCIHSAYRSPTERFCNRKKPYWTLRLDQWADGISSCCSLPTHSDFQSERAAVLDNQISNMLDIGEILESLCKTDLYWYNKGVTEGEDVGKCRGKDCNYCGRYNEKLRHQAGEP